MTASNTISAVLSGIGVNPGPMTDPVVRMAPPTFEPEITTPEPSRDVEKECKYIVLAAQQVKKGLELSATEAKVGARTFLETAARMATDPTLTSMAQAMVYEKRPAPERVMWESAGTLTSMLESLSGYMAERIRGVQDVHDHIAAVLTKSLMPGIPCLPKPFVLVAADLAPADIVLLDPKKIIVFITSEGGLTPHTATLAYALGMPAIVGTGEKATGALAGDDIVLADGTRGSITLNPSEDALHRTWELASRVRVSNSDGATEDGHEVQLLASAGDAVGVRSTAGVGAMGIDLFRIEFCFPDQLEESTVEVQVETYQGVLETFPDKKVVVRTLDAGVDKSLPFLTDVIEANPASGMRAYRTTRRGSGVLDHQFEVLAKAETVTEAKTWVMVPTISTAEEAKALAQEARSYGLKMARMTIEVPPVALMADKLFEYADFVSVGINDPTQYVMAADRLLSSLANLPAAWQSAVLRLTGIACEGASPKGHPVGVCDEATADPVLATVLVGLGVVSLPMTARALPDIDTVLKSVTLVECQELARIVLDAATVGDVHSAVRVKLPTPEELGS